VVGRIVWDSTNHQVAQILVDVQLESSQPTDLCRRVVTTSLGSMYQIFGCTQYGNSDWAIEVGHHSGFTYWTFRNSSWFSEADGGGVPFILLTDGSWESLSAFSQQNPDQYYAVVTTELKDELAYLKFEAASIANAATAAQSSQLTTNQQSQAQDQFHSEQQAFTSAQNQVNNTLQQVPASLPDAYSPFWQIIGNEEASRAKNLEIDVAPDCIFDSLYGCAPS
jgi:hypothetical protein